MYYVAPFTESKWNILFDNQRRPYVYDSPDEALKAARRAAQDNFSRRHQP